MTIQSMLRRHITACRSRHVKNPKWDSASMLFCNTVELVHAESYIRTTISPDHPFSISVAMQQAKPSDS